MKAAVTKYITIFIMIWIVSCKGPSPTELLYDNSNNELDIEILTPSPEVIDNAPGYDSTGVIDSVPESANVITVNGIKTTTNNGRGMNYYYASAMFYNKEQPVRLPNNRLVGYMLRSVESVRFDNFPATKTQKRIEFIFNGNEHDTLLGTFYEMRHSRRKMHQHGFPYNSVVNFNLETLGGNQISFDIPTPEEITGEVKVRGSRDEKNIRLAIEWNENGTGEIDIVVAGYSSRNTVEPFFRVRTEDNGSYELSKDLLKNIPFDEFHVLVVTLVRSLKLDYSDPELNDNLITGKSIHNIKFNVP